MALDITYKTGAPTVGTTEYGLVAQSTTLGAATTAGVYSAFIDFNAMTSADTFVVKLYEKARAADTQRLVETWTVQGAQTKMWTMVPLLLGAGWELTVTKSAGTDRSLPYSIRQVA